MGRPAALWRAAALNHLWRWIGDDQNEVVVAGLPDADVRTFAM
jgi:hypothetical protein